MHSLSTRSWMAVVLLGMMLLPGAQAGARRSVDTLPLPETSGDYGWLEAQRIRFDNGRLFKYAQAAVAAGDYAVARDHLIEALGHDPGSNRARLGLIEVNEKLERWDDAIAMCDTVIGDYPDYADAYVRKAALATKKGDLDLAISAYQGVIDNTKSRDARNLSARRSLGELAFQAGDYATAASHAASILKKRDSLVLRLFLAECAVKQKNAAEALTQFDAALRLAETDTQRGEIQLARGFILYSQANYGDARTALEAAITLVPERIDRASVLRQLGDTAYRQKDFAKAAETFKACLQEGFDEEVAGAYVESLVASEAWGTALSEGERFIDRQGTSEAFRWRMLTALVQIYKHEGKHDLTYRVASEAYAGTQKPTLLLDMAYAAEAIGMRKEAMAHLGTYLESQFDATPALAYHYLLKEARRFEEAETVLTRVLGIENLSPQVRKDALYELAQVYRQTERADDYFKTMNRLITKESDDRFLMEYAALLSGVGRYERALELFEDCLSRGPTPEDSFFICRNMAEVCLALGQPAKSREWLEAATTHGEPDTAWQLLMARVEYNEKDFEACVNRLLDLDVRNDVINLYIGFSFYKLKMQGLALYHLNMVEDLEALPSEQRYNLLSNRAYLHYDQGLYEAAQLDIEQALALQPSEDMDVVNLKSMVALAQYEEARALALKLIKAGDEQLEADVRSIADRHPNSPLKRELEGACGVTETRAMVAILRGMRAWPDSDLKMEIMLYLTQHRIRLVAELLELAGLSELRNENYEEAVAVLSEALDLEPLRASAYYLRGIAQQRLGDHEAAEADLLMYRDSASRISPMFWGDFGIVEGKLKQYGPGTESLRNAVGIYPTDIDSFEEAGYQYMKAVSNTYSKAAFGDALSIYNEITPYLEGEDKFEYKNKKDEMKREYSKLDRRFGGAAYLSRTEFDFPSPVAVPALGGALPLQSGLELNWRPPVIGYRNERRFEVFGRVLANVEYESWNLDEESYQGGVGVRYQPFRTLNTIVAFERLFEIGDNSEDNWLLRFLGTREWGERPSDARPYQLNTRLYGDLGVFLEERERWYYYLDGRTGVSWYTGRDKILLTVPQGLGVLRYESNDDSNLLSYSELGIGLHARFLEPERKFVTERWYIDFYAYYIWGWWWEEPIDEDQTDFEGFVIGVSLLK